jgi:hypothetical protein
MFQDSIFAMHASNISIDRFYITGETGSDGDGVEDQEPVISVVSRNVSYALNEVEYIGGIKNLELNASKYKVDINYNSELKPYVAPPTPPTINTISTWTSPGNRTYTTVDIKGGSSGVYTAEVVNRYPSTTRVDGSVTTTNFPGPFYAMDFGMIYNGNTSAFGVNLLDPNNQVLRDFANSPEWNKPNRWEFSNDSGNTWLYLDGGWARGQGPGLDMMSTSISNNIQLVSNTSAPFSLRVATHPRVISVRNTPTLDFAINVGNLTRIEMSNGTIYPIENIVRTSDGNGVDITISYQDALTLEYQDFESTYTHQVTPAQYEPWIRPDRDFSTNTAGELVGYKLDYVARSDNYGFQTGTAMLSYDPNQFGVISNGISVGYSSQWANGNMLVSDIVYNNLYPNQHRGLFYIRNDGQSDTVEVQWSGKAYYLV